MIHIFPFVRFTPRVLFSAFRVSRARLSAPADGGRDVIQHRRQRRQQQQSGVNVIVGSRAIAHTAAAAAYTSPTGGHCVPGRGKRPSRLVSASDATVGTCTANGRQLVEIIPPDNGDGIGRGSRRVVYR